MEWPPASPTEEATEKHPLPGKNPERTVKNPMKRRDNRRTESLQFVQFVLGRIDFRQHHHMEELQLYRPQKSFSFLQKTTADAFIGVTPAVFQKQMKNPAKGDFL